MNRNEKKFISELEVATRMRPDRGAVLLLLTIVSLFSFLIVYSAFAKINERTRGTGQVMPSSDIQVVQSLEGGIVTEILIREGDIVKKGQILMRIDDVLVASEEGGLEARLQGLKVRHIRLNAEADGTVPEFPAELKELAPKIVENEIALYKSRQTGLKTAIAQIEAEKRETLSNIDEIKASIRKYSQSRTLLGKELDIAKSLVTKHAMPEIEQIRLEREYAIVSGDLRTAQEARQSLDARLGGIEKKIAEKYASFKSEALGKLSETQIQLRALEESMTLAEERVARTDLRAPVDGIIQSMAIKTVGGVVEPAQKLIEIVPLEEDLLIRARVSPADIAFIHTGQPVKVSITAYDPLIYGRLDGTLERISADTIEDQKGNLFFEVDVRTAKNHLGTVETPLRITTGMVANIEIITGRRSILTYLMKPILRAKAKALSER